MSPRLCWTDNHRWGPRIAGARLTVLIGLVFVATTTVTCSSGTGIPLSATPASQGTSDESGGTESSSNGGPGGQGAETSQPLNLIAWLSGFGPGSPPGPQEYASDGAYTALVNQDCDVA